MDDELLAECEGAIGYVFRDRSLLVTALTHASAVNEVAQHNERLEFLGDAVLGLVVCENLYARFEDLSEGELTEIKSDVVSARALARAVKGWQLERFLRVGKGLSRGRRIPRKLLGNTFETILGAIFLDAGLDVARRFALEALHEEIERVLAMEHELNYKSMLQNYSQATFQSTPRYQVHAESGPDHAKVFDVTVLIGDEERGRGRGRSKKEAEQAAARRAYENILGQEEGQKEGQAQDAESGSEAELTT